ncbi:MAG TPA: 6-bladed beta-propeller [Acidobacteriota bacterium]|nr:6-bladed beta-propeller [Acidobacteriota bacterium]
MKKLIIILSAAVIILITIVIVFPLFLPKRQSIKTTELKPLRTFGGLDVSEEAILSSPSDMVINPDGNIIVSDSRENKIIVFDRDGRVINQFGRQGKGPGELHGVRYIGVKEDALKVYEANNNRIQYFSFDGQYLNMIPLRFNIGMGGFVFGDNDDVFIATNGFRTSELIRHYRISGEKLDSIGKIEGEPFKGYYMFKIQEDLIKKKVPDEFRNNIILFQSQERNLYAFYQSLPLVKIYSEKGELKEVVSLDIPEYEEIVDSCSKLNLEIKKEGEPAFSPLRIWRDGFVSDKGDLILLLWNSEKMILYKFDKEARLVHCYKGVDDNISLIAAHGPDLWAYGQDTQIFYQFQLE